MSLLVRLACLSCLLIALVGCSDEGTGHADDPTPGGEPTPPMDALSNDKAFDDYARQQAKQAR